MGSAPDELLDVMERIVFHLEEEAPETVRTPTSGPVDAAWTVAG
ncbi:hypothetical protein ACIPUC_14295 [Streptomyces sp. LARHCF249]